MSDSKISDVFIKLNPFIKWLLNSRWHGLLSHQLMLIKFNGRKSGKSFMTPVAYTKHNKAFLIGIAETKTRVWWRNFRSVWPMKVKVEGEWLSGKAELLTIEHADFQSEWQAKVTKKHMDKVFKITVNKGGQLTQAQLEDLHQRCGLVRFIAE